MGDPFRRNGRGLRKALAVVARAACLAAGLGDEGGRLRCRRPVALVAIADVLRIRDLVGLRDGGVAAAVERELVAHVELVDEDGEIDEGFAVDQGRVAGPREGRRIDGAWGIEIDRR